MRKMYVLMASLCVALSLTAQTDSSSTRQEDTLNVGRFRIIKKGDGKYENTENTERIVQINHERRGKWLSTNWIIVDLGFNNYRDETNYTSAAAAGVVASGINKDDFNLRTGKSVNVNIWLFMQRLSMIKNVVNLKYGLGVELNNYRYNSPLLYDTKNNIFNKDLVRNYSKNKLAADYVTIPVMLNFNFTPNRSYNHTFGFSAGVSAGYLYASRQKVITNENGKQKNRDDFHLRPFKISYVAELQLGFIKLYGSMATQSMFEKGLDQTPYNFGLRLSNW